MYKILTEGGGMDVPINKFMFMVSLQFKGTEKHICSAAKIGVNKAVSAGHCKDSW